MNKKGLFSALSVMTAAAALVSGVGVAQAAPPTPTQHAVKTTHEVHGKGFDYKAARAAHKGAPQVKLDSRRYTELPAAYSLEQYALPAGNQGAVGSCVTWATGYTGYGILMNEAKAKGAPMAPMFIYSQIVNEYNHGQDNGTYASIALPMEKQRGIDTQSHYWQGTTDYKTLPTASEKANALHYKLGGYTDLTNSNRTAAIKNAISLGHPVAIGFRGRSNFEGLDSSNSYYDPSEGTLQDWGHEVTIIGYDADGVKVENSWGTGWGDNGYFTAPWSWVTSSDVDEVHSMNSLSLS